MPITTERAQDNCNSKRGHLLSRMASPQTAQKISAARQIQPTRSRQPEQWRCHRSLPVPNRGSRKTWRQRGRCQWQAGQSDYLPRVAAERADGVSYGFNKVLDYPSATEIQSALRAGLGVALLSGMHITPDIEVIEGVFPPPPDIAFIARTNRKIRDAATDALVGEIARMFPATKR